MLFIVNYICIININKMTETYEEFIALKIKDLDLYIIKLYDLYVSRSTIFFQHEEDDVLFENSVEWFNNYFVYFINSEDYRPWIDEYQLIPLNTSNDFAFKEQLTNDYNNTIYEDVIVMICGINQIEHYLKTEINENFIDNYIYNILNFEHFKNILYEHGIYNETFAEEVELK